MAATKSPALLPVPGETPESASDPYLGAPLAQNPYAAQALTTNILPSFEDSLRNPPPAAPVAPAADPYAGAPVVEAAAPDAYAGAPVAGEVRGYDLTKLKASKVEDLVKDKSEFNPVEFYAKNTDALLADPQALKLVEDAYEQREKERMTAGQFAKAIITSPLHPIETAKTLGKAVKGAGEFVGELGKGVGQVFKTTGQAAGALSAGDLKETAARAAEVVDAFDSAQQKWVTTLTSKLLPRPTGIRERLAYDADLKRKEIDAAAGNGELAHALGTDQESLKASGVTLDPAAIQKLSVIEDPMFLVPVGGAIGVVSKSGKFLLGKAITPAAAEAFAKVTNSMLERAAGGTVELAGKGVGAVGTGVEKAGELAGKALEKVGGFGKGALIYHNPVAAIGLAAPTLLKYTGKGLGAVAEGIQKAAPFVGKVGLEGVKGAAEGAALSVPLFIGSTPEEREGLLGMIGGAGALRAGGTALGLGAHVGATAAQEKLASKIYEPVNRGPIKDSPHYGTDAKLDEAHAQQAASLPPGQQSVLSWAREFFRNAGIEIYALDNKTFQNHVPNVAGAAAAEGFFTTKGERVNADGTRQPVVQVLLNGETNGLGHELYHAFKSLDPASAQALESHISKTWTPEEQAWIADTYNAALNGGKPKSQWKVTYDKNQILEEAAAEVFGRVLTATDLSGVRPSVVKRASEFASRALDKMGYPLGGKALPAGPGVSALGVRPGHAELKVARDFLADIAQRVRDGTLTPPKPAKAPEASTARPAPVPPPTPSEPPPAPAAPQPATPPKAPVAPAPAAPEAPNIRVTPKEQLDFAAERSKVTNADEALAAAQKTGDSQQVTHVQTINDSMAQGHGVEIVHKGVIREGGPTPEKPVARGTRRSEQEAAYVAEAMGAVPDDIREAHQKVLFGTRWQQTKKSGPQLTARSLDKVLANVKNAADMAAQTKTALPYEVDPATGKLTDAGWSEVVRDLKDYWGNQDRGFRGDGEKLVRPVKDIGVSLPPEDPRGPATHLSPERTDFLNLVQGLNIPESVTRQLPGKIPGNVKGQLLAEAQGKKPAKPAAIRPEDIGRQTYKPIEGVVGVRSIAEVNPLRNDLRAKGAPVGNLIEVTENVNLKDIESVTPRPDVPGSGGSTDITRAGFSVSDTRAEVARRLEEKKKAGIPITERVRKKTQQEVEFDLRSGKKLGTGEAAGFFSLKSNPSVKAEIDAVLRGEKPGETFNMDGTVFSPGDRKLDVVPLGDPQWAEVGFNPTKHSYFYEKGTEEPVVSGSQAVSVGNSVFVKDPVFGNKADYAFSVKPAEAPEERIAKTRTGEHVTQKKTPGTPEYNAFVENKIQNSLEFPEAFPLDFRKDKNGNYLAQWNGDPLPKARPYDLLKSHLAKEVGSEEKFRDALAENLKREYHEAKKDPVVAEGEHWYSNFRDKMGGILGDDAKLFAELLGATSPQQAVGPNFKDALGAYNQFKSGAYDDMLAKYQEGKKKFADGDLTEFSAETGKTGKKATKEAFLGWWQKKYNLVPTKSTGKKFGMNSRAVLKVLDGSWLAGVQGPKTPNFTGNLSGTTFKATIDVWAMRLLSRLANEKNPNPWRIQPANESGVQDKEFFFGQDAFQKAADDLGIKADALQAILWFAEKDLWEKNGWTAAAGKAKSDYNTLLERTTKTPEGKLHFEPQEVKPKSKAKKATQQLELSDVKQK